MESGACIFDVLTQHHYSCYDTVAHCLKRLNRSTTGQTARSRGQRSATSSKWTCDEERRLSGICHHCCDVNSPLVELLSPQPCRIVQRVEAFNQDGCTHILLSSPLSSDPARGAGHGHAAINPERALYLSTTTPIHIVISFLPTICPRAGLVIMMLSTSVSGASTFSKGSMVRKRRCAPADGLTHEDLTHRLLILINRSSTVFSTATG